MLHFTVQAQLVPVRIEHLLSLLSLHPYESPAWDCEPFTIAEVLACTDPDPGDYDTWDDTSRTLHIAHIAHLAQAWPNDGTAAPELMIYQGVTLVDGWHRLAAAMARGDQQLCVELSGDGQEAQTYGITIR